MCRGSDSHDPPAKNSKPSLTSGEKENHAAMMAALKSSAAVLEAPKRPFPNKPSTTSKYISSFGSHRDGPRTEMTMVMPRTAMMRSIRRP